jgi:hypothetical protein
MIGVQFRAIYTESLRDMTDYFKLIVYLLLPALTACTSVSQASLSSLTLFDQSRLREIPIELHFPAKLTQCSAAQPCPVAIISAGYQVKPSAYSFIASTLNDLDYLVVTVQHELPSDPPLATSGDLFANRSPNWQRGAENLRFVRDSLHISQPQFDWNHPLLVGHSNGGDISAWILRESPDFADTLITLDNRRVPLPRNKTRVLSIRASDFPADAGVLPGIQEQLASASCVLKIDHARHNDMQDKGPADLKKKIAQLIRRFLQEKNCDGNRM